MSDRIPGSSRDNPIWYRGYRIHLNDGSDTGPHLGGYVFRHDDYDGAEDANDHRYGFGRTVEECKAEIDELEDDA
jgi:hypothetical protein